MRRVVGIKVDYLINNANLSYETTSELIVRGEEMLAKVSEIIDVPVKFTVIPDFINEDGKKFKYPIFKIKRFMRMEI